jgi:hypothetical protein
MIIALYSRIGQHDLFEWCVFVKFIHNGTRRHGVRAPVCVRRRRMSDLRYRHFA